MAKDELMHVEPQITKGNIWSIGATLATFIGMGATVLWSYSTTDARTTENAKAIMDARAERGQMEIRLRSLETQQARADERFSNILSYLARIDSRLERIENK